MDGHNMFPLMTFKNALLRVLAELMFMQGVDTYGHYKFWYQSGARSLYINVGKLTDDF